MSMALSDIRSFVRLSLDLDADDLPDSLVDLYAREGFTKLIRDQARWPFYEKQWTFTLVATQSDYPLATVGADLEEPTAIFGNDGVLIYRDQQEMENSFPVNNTNSIALPTDWSLRRDIISLWPIPSSSTTVLTVDGYRAPTAMTSAGSQPDCPSDMHECIAMWALGRAYQQQDELDQANLYFQTFAEQKHLLEGRYLKLVNPRPIVLNSLRGRRRGTLPPRLRFGFDGH